MMAYSETVCNGGVAKKCGLGLHLRNVTKIVLLGVRGKYAKTMDPGRTQVNLITSRKQGHSRKPDEPYEVIESCSPGAYLELFARRRWPNWVHGRTKWKVKHWKNRENHRQKKANKPEDTPSTKRESSG
jgi:N6-adenosine-specific RNA methylase IME4